MTRSGNHGEKILTTTNSRREECHGSPPVVFSSSSEKGQRSQGIRDALLVCLSGFDVTWPAKTAQSAVRTVSIHAGRGPDQLWLFLLLHMYTVASMATAHWPSNGRVSLVASSLSTYSTLPCKSSKSLTEKGPPPLRSSPQKCETESQAFGLAANEAYCAVRSNEVWGSRLGWALSSLIHGQLQRSRGPECSKCSPGLELT